MSTKPSADPPLVSGVVVKECNVELTAEEQLRLDQAKQSLQAKARRKKLHARKAADQKEQQANQPAVGAPQKRRHADPLPGKPTKRPITEIADFYGLPPEIIEQVCQEHGVHVQAGSAVKTAPRDEMPKLRNALRVSGMRIPLSAIAKHRDLDVLFVSDAAREIGLNVLRGEEILVKEFSRLKPMLTRDRAQKFAEQDENQWLGSGEHSARVRASLNSSGSATGSAPFVKVVSGGLPTLGRGRR